MSYERKKVELSLLGRDSVGKSSILERYLTNSYIEDQFAENYNDFSNGLKDFHENEIYNSIIF